MIVNLFLIVKIGRHWPLRISVMYTEVDIKKDLGALLKNEVIPPSHTPVHQAGDSTGHPEWLQFIFVSL